MKKIIFIVIFVYSYLHAFDILYEADFPYVYEKDGKATGVFIKKLSTVLDKSNIKYKFIQKNKKIQLNYLKNSKINICAIGWEKTKDYKKIFKYTSIFYKTPSYGIITQRRYNIEANTHIDKIIADRQYRVLVKKDFSYGKKLDDILKRLPKKRINTKKDYNLVTLVAKKKGDFVFISYKDAKKILAKHRYKSRIKFVPIIGIKKDIKKYFVCSKNTKSSVIDIIKNNKN